MVVRNADCERWLPGGHNDRDMSKRMGRRSAGKGEDCSKLRCVQQEKQANKKIQNTTKPPNHQT